MVTRRYQTDPIRNPNDKAVTRTPTPSPLREIEAAMVTQHRVGRGARVGSTRARSGCTARTQGPACRCPPVPPCSKADLPSFAADRGLDGAKRPQSPRPSPLTTPEPAPGRVRE